jgi:DNA-binding transcriptional ArsR family regulator
LFHPPIENVTVEGILHALSDPVRVAIFADLASSDCAYNCSTFLNVTNKQIPKSTLSHHFKALRDAGLIRTERHGVEMHNSSRCSEIESRFLDSWAPSSTPIRFNRRARAKKRAARKGKQSS